MSFRYKSALLSLVSLLVLYGYYFARVVSAVHFGGHIGNPVGLLVEVLVAIVAVQIVGHAVIALTSAERYARMDERERGFDRRATTIGYYLLIVGALAAIATMHIGATKPMMGNAMLLAIVIAECARQAIFLALHHRAS